MSGNKKNEKDQRERKNGHSHDIWVKQKAERNRLQREARKLKP